MDFKVTSSSSDDDPVPDFVIRRKSPNLQALLSASQSSSHLSSMCPATHLKGFKALSHIAHEAPTFFM